MREMNSVRCATLSVRKSNIKQHRTGWYQNNGKPRPCLPQPFGPGQELLFCNGKYLPRCRESSLRTESNRIAPRSSDNVRFRETKTPGEASAQHVEHGVDDLAQRPRPRTTRGLGARKITIDHAPFLVVQTGLAALRAAANSVPCRALPSFIDSLQKTPSPAPSTLPGT